MITATLLPLLLESCVTTTVVKEIEDTVESNRNLLKSKADEIKVGYLELKIHNLTENTNLQIDSLEICNIQLQNADGISTQMGNMKLDTLPAKLPVQTFTPWNTTTLPTSSKGMYVKLYGTMYTFIAGSQPFALWSGPMYFTFNGSISEISTTKIDFKIQDNCPLYCIVDGHIEKVLQSIQFQVTVDNWK